MILNLSVYNIFQAAVINGRDHTAVKSTESPARCMSSVLTEFVPTFPKAALLNTNFAWHNAVFSVCILKATVSVTIE